jgi:hypothetical protein
MEDRFLYKFILLFIHHEIESYTLEVSQGFVYETLAQQLGITPRRILWDEFSKAKKLLFIAEAGGIGSLLLCQIYP